MQRAFTILYDSDLPAVIFTASGSAYTFTNGVFGLVNSGEIVYADETARTSGTPPCKSPQIVLYHI